MPGAWFSIYSEMFSNNENIHSVFENQNISVPIYLWPLAESHSSYFP